MEKAPAVRVAAARDMFEFLEQAEPGSGERLWSRVPEASRRFIADLARVAWIPLEHDHWLPEAIEAEFGPDAAREHFRRCIPRMVGRPLLEPLVNGILRIVGRQRTRLLKVVPLGWDLVFRDFCEPRVGEAEAGRLELRFDDVTPAVRSYPAYFLMWEGVCRGLLDLTEPGGSLDYEVAPDRSSVSARFSW